VGWSGSVADDRATEFVESCYQQLASGAAIPCAAAYARQRLRELGTFPNPLEVLQDPTFALPQVYCSVTGTGVFDPQAPTNPPASSHWDTRRHLIQGSIRGLRSGFIGRRHECQKVVRLLREGDKTFAVITGNPGIGKSTFATRVAVRLEEAGFEVVAVPVKAGPPDDEHAQPILAAVVKALDDAFVRAARMDLHWLLANRQLSKSQRLRLLVDALNKLRLALVLDGLEGVIEVNTNRICDEDFAELYAQLANHLVRGSCVIVTSRHLPAFGTGARPGAGENILHVPLGDLEEHNFRKFLERDPEVARRIREGEISERLLRAMYAVLGGNPSILENMRAVLRICRVSQLTDLGSFLSGPVKKSQEQYYQQICAAHLYEALSQEAKQLASLLALSELPLPLEAITTECGQTLEVATKSLQDCVGHGLIQEFPEDGFPTLYSPPALLRSYLLAAQQFGPDQVEAMHGFLAQFWHRRYEDGQIDKRLCPEMQLATCRQHARLGGCAALFRWASLELSHRLKGQAEWREAVSMLQEVPDAEQDLECLIELADLCKWLGDLKAAKLYLLRILDRAPEGSSARGSAWHQLAAIDFYGGNIDAARKKFTNALLIRQVRLDSPGEADTLFELAAIDLHQSRFAEAQAGFRKVLEMRRKVGDRAGEAAALHQLASIEFHRNDYKAARRNFAAALSLRKALGDRAGEAATWHQLGSIDLHAGRYNEARQQIRIALEIRQGIGDRAGEAASWHQLGSIDFEEAIRLSEGDTESCQRRESKLQEAREKLQEALALRKAIGDRAGQAATLHQLGSTDRHQGRLLGARKQLGRALRLRRGIRERAGVAATLQELATVDLHQRKHEPAQRKYREALRIWREIGNLAAQGSILLAEGYLAFRQEKHRTALNKYLEALSLRRSLRDQKGEEETLLYLGSLAYQQKRPWTCLVLLVIAFLVRLGDLDLAVGEAKQYVRFTLRPDSYFLVYQDEDLKAEVMGNYHDGNYDLEWIRRGFDDGVP
jgi:tetratricopeptide (TPR) repeat protein